jgi:hypothetical protein
MVCLPPKLERLEVVENRYGATRWTGSVASGVPLDVRSGGKMTGVMKRFAGCCAQGIYPALKHVVLWCQGWGDKRYGWSAEVQEEVKAMFLGAGVAFELRSYEPWPEGEVSGWRSLSGGMGTLAPDR